MISDAPLARWRAETRAAVGALAVGMELARRRVGAQVVHTKGAGAVDLATDTDLAVEDAVRAELARRCPGHPVVGEERGGAAPPNAPFWLVDPICGTRNYASDLPLYAINIALVEGGHAVAAVVGDPARAVCLVAEAGRGALHLADAGATPARADAGSAIIVLDYGVPGEGSGGARAVAFTSAAIRAARWHLRMFGTSLAFAQVATGQVAAMLLFQTSSPVHFAAGCHLVEEAGGVVTDTDGRPWTLASQGLIAAASAGLHHELLGMLAEAPPA